MIQKIRKKRNRFDLLGSIQNDIQQYHQKNSTAEAALNKESDKLKREFGLHFFVQFCVFFIIFLNLIISKNLPLLMDAIFTT